MLNINIVQKHAKATGTNKVQTQAKKACSQEGAKKRAPVKSKGEHLCQSGKMQSRKRALVKPEGSTYAGARSACERQEGTKV